MKARFHSVARPAQALLAGCLLSLWTTGSAALPQELPRGDVNRDGVLDISDLLKLARHLNGDTVLDPEFDAEVIYAADLAPLTAGVVGSDGVIDQADFVVLVQLLSGTLGTEPPILDPLPAPTANPLPANVKGDAPSGTLIHLFVSNGAGTVVHVDTTTADAMDRFSFASVPLLFDGTNEFFAIADDGSGLRSAPSSIQTASWTNTAPQNPSCAPPPPATPCKLTTTQVWTALAGGASYLIPSGGLEIADGVKLILGPGAVLQFASAADRLTAKGTLHAFGAPAAEVLFTATSWSGILFEPATTSAASWLSHARIQQITQGARAAVLQGGSGPSNVVTFRDSVIDTRAFVAHGIQISSSNATLTLDWSSVLGKVGAALNNHGIHYNSATAASLVRHSTVSTFDQCIRNVNSNATQHLIQQTTIEDCSTGIHSEASVGTYSPGNRIRNNTKGVVLQASVQCGQGISSCWTFFPTVQNSVFQGNGTNVQATGAPWREGNETRIVMNARNNVWDSIDGFAIADSIDDVTDHLTANAEGFVRDDISDGLLVDFTPFLPSEGGQGEYRYISGDLDLDFPSAGPVVPFRQAVGPVMLRRNRPSATIPAGTTIETFVDPDVLVEIPISQDLLIQGTDTSPVEFVAPGANPAPGDWWGLRFDSDSTASELQHLRIRHAHEAIGAEGTSISIDGADIGLFAQAGVVLDSVDSSSEVLNSIIDGLLDPGPPEEVTVKDDAHSNIVGIQIIDSFPGCPPGSCAGSISGNTIRNLVTGIHVLGLSDPQILDNEITDNIWGIWLQGQTSGDPQPLITGNEIHDNFGATPTIAAFTNETHFRFCSAQGGANLCLSDYAATGAGTVINATENYWLATDDAGVRDSVLNIEGQRVAVDLSDYTNDSGVPVGPSTGLLSALLVDVSGQGDTSMVGSACIGATPSLRAACVIRPKLASDDFTIRYHLHRQSDVMLEIFNHPDTMGTPVFSAVLPGTPTAGGPAHEYAWDGTKTSGAFVSDGAYAWVLTATATTAPTIVDRHDPEISSGQFIEQPQEPHFWYVGDSGKGEQDAGYASAFNSFVNDHFVYNYGLATLPLRGKPFSSVVTARVLRRDPATQICQAQKAGEGLVLATPWLDRPLWTGTHTLIWDGRADSTVDPTTGFTAGQIVPSAIANDLCLDFGIPRPLKPNHVIVANNQPTMLRPGAPPSVRLRSDPVIIRPAYEQSTKVEFTVDQNSTVTLYILPPGVTDLGQAVGKVRADGGAEIPANTPKSVEWQGWENFDDLTHTETNYLRAQTDGPYTFALEAKSAADPELVSVYRGVINIRGELPPGS